MKVLLVVTNFDVSSYTDGKVYGEEDIIELTCALVRINRLHEAGEAACSSDELFEAGQLAVIRQILDAHLDSNSDNDKWMKLYQKLRDIEQD